MQKEKTNLKFWQTILQWLVLLFGVMPLIWILVFVSLGNYLSCPSKSGMSDSCYLMGVDIALAVNLNLILPFIYPIFLFIALACLLPLILINKKLNK